MQVVLYARVSTARQFANGLSVPDQLRQMHQWCDRQGHTVTREYIEPGDTATDDKREVFQEMIFDAQNVPSPFELIVVHSFSRFFRDEIEATLYERKLAKFGVKMVSITQHTSDDPSGEIQRRLIMLFDEYQSKENAKHTLRGMQENARQGYFNGSTAPFGYQAIAVGQTGTHGRVKKKLAIEPAEAEIVRKIYSLYVLGFRGQRVGIKEITRHLNEMGLTMRGRAWRVQKVHDILSSTTYAGTHVFNQWHRKTGTRKDTAHWITVAVPGIVEQATFDKVAQIRKAHTPGIANPRCDNLPTLLTGMVRCGHCGSSMLVITGKSGRYRYYKCTRRMNGGNAVCASRNVPLERLDDKVLEKFRTVVHSRGHIESVVSELKRLATTHTGGDRKQQMKELVAGVAEADQALTRLYEAVEKGCVELDAHLKERIERHRTRKEGLLAEVARLKAMDKTPSISLTPRKLQAVTNMLNKRLSSASPFARAYLRASRCEIRVRGDDVELSGNNAALAELVAGNASVGNTVPSFVPSGTPTRYGAGHWQITTKLGLEERSAAKAGKSGSRTVKKQERPS